MEHTVRRKRDFLKTTFPKAIRLFNPKVVKNPSESEDFSSSPTSITRSSTGNEPHHKRLVDRSTASFETSSSDDYVERFPLSPEQDDELSREITRRQSSAVRAKVNKYDQLHAKSRMDPLLREIRGMPMSRFSQIYARVQSFEKIEADSKRQNGPDLEELRKRREKMEPRCRSCISTAPLYTL